MCIANMLKFKLLFVLSVFQVSSANVTTIVNTELTDISIAYKLIAISAEYIPGFFNRYGDEGELVISDTRWYAKKSFNAEKDVSFYLYTKNTLDRREDIRLHDSNSLKASDFNPLHPTRIIIHGWLGSEFAGVFFSLTPAYLRKGNYNVVLVDWGKGAIADYTTVSQRVKPVGIVLAKFVDFLHKESGVNFENIYLIGFSMGAHIAGIAGKCVLHGRIPVIFGLDPALPMFSFEKTDERLTSNDANYVEVIHTNAGGYGYEKALGDVDFYVNYGNEQPGCFLAECSHLRAFKVFAESINSKVGFWAKGCDASVVRDLLRKRRCFQPTSARALLGGDSARKHLKGVFYLTTNFLAPYAQGRLMN